MSQTAIRIENLGKEYRIGQGGSNAGYRTLRETMTDLARAPLRWVSKKNKKQGEETIWALKDVSFEIKHGEVVGIIGRNGAGKSTLLKILSRITEPTKGIVDIYGQVGSLLEVGTGFHPELTGRENIYLNGAILGMKRREIENKFDEIVAFSEVEKFIDTPVKHYSSGMYLRLAFSVAAFLEPDVLLVDEVLAVGDLEFQKKCLGRMENVSKEGRTVLFVSHNMAAVENLCTKGIVIDKGKITFEGDIAESIDFYVNSSRNNQATFETHSGNVFHSIEIVDEGGKPQTKLKIGDPIIFRIDLSSHPGFEILLGIGINNHFGSRITTIQSQYTGFDIPATDQPMVIQCRIDHLTLAPGEYGIKMAAATPYGREVEVVEEPIFFEVIHSDFWKHGHLPSARQGVVLANHEWKALLKDRK